MVFLSLPTVRSSPMTGFYLFQDVILLLHLVPDPRIFNILIRKLPLTSEDMQAQKNSLGMQNFFWGAGPRTKPVVWQKRGAGKAAEKGGSGSTCCPSPQGTTCAHQPCGSEGRSNGVPPPPAPLEPLKHPGPFGTAKALQIF